MLATVQRETKCDPRVDPGIFTPHSNHCDGALVIHQPTWRSTDSNLLIGAFYLRNSKELKVF